MASVAGVPDAVTSVIASVDPALTLPGRAAQLLAFYGQAVRRIDATQWGSLYADALGYVIAAYLEKFPLNGAMTDRSVVVSESSPTNGSTSFAQIDMCQRDAFWGETAGGRLYLNLRGSVNPRSIRYVI